MVYINTKKREEVLTVKSEESEESTGSINDRWVKSMLRNMEKKQYT